jgi:hypothetical protein
LRVAEQGYLAPLDHGAGSSCRSLYALALMFPPKPSSHTHLHHRAVDGAGVQSIHVQVEPQAAQAVRAGDGGQPHDLGLVLRQPRQPRVQCALLGRGEVGDTRIPSGGELWVPHEKTLLLYTRRGWVTEQAPAVSPSSADALKGEPLARTERETKTDESELAHTVIDKWWSGVERAPGRRRGSRGCLRSPRGTSARPPPRCARSSS